MDVWFTRYDDVLFVATAKKGQEPTQTPMKVRDNVRGVLRRMVERGYRIDSVGICPPDMLGLE